MLIPFDDYPIHQTSLPLAQTGSGNPHHYDRFWFNGFREDLIFGVAFCSYPNRQLMDGAFSVVRGGRQQSVFASGRINADPVDTSMGPIRIEIVEPMRVNRVIVDAAEHGIEADLTYRAVTAAVEEARQINYEGARQFMDSTRATQWGTWTGTLRINGEDIPLGEGGIQGTKDRSWGARTTFGSYGGAPTPLPEVLFLWAPIHFDEEAFHFLAFERPDGSQWAHDALVIPKVKAGQALHDADARPRRLARVDHFVEWIPGTRRSRRATLVAHSLDGTSDEMTLEPVMTFQMKGIGYGNPRWGHGEWHDELVVGGEVYDVESLDRLLPENVHVQQVVRAHWRGRAGLGVLEQVILGPHDRYGFREFIDGAPS
jgi:hypothetical protein